MNTKVQQSLIFFGLFAMLQLSIHSVCNAQSNYYWSEKFNTQSSLLAGAVVGGEAGATAVYYNPALINQDESNKFSFSANLFSFQSLNVENAIGEGTQIDKFAFQLQPKFLSYTGASKKYPKINFELAFLVPLTSNIQVSYLTTELLDIIDRLDGEEDYFGEFSFRYLYDDYYIGGGLSLVLSDQFTIGASSFISLKVLDYRNFISMKAMQNTDTVYSQGVPEPFYFAQTSYFEQVKYWDMSILFKLGVHYQSANGNWGIGLNLTTPNLSIYGNGTVIKESYRSSIFDNSAGEFITDRAFASAQENVKTNIKDPLAIAFGIQFSTPSRKNIILFTTEYFMAIDPYEILKTTDSKVIGNMQLENVAEVMTFYSSAKAVLNVGVGFVQEINDVLSLNAGLRTDLNTNTYVSQDKLDIIGSDPRLSNFYFDKFHLIAGTTMSLKKFGLVLGIQYTTGSEENLRNIVTFVNPVEYDPLTNASLQGQRTGNMKFNYNEVSFFFGLSYGIGK